VKPLKILNESVPFFAPRSITILLVGVCSGTLTGNDGRRRGRRTLSIHRGGAVRRSAAICRTARRQRRDQQRAEHGNVAVRSKAVNVRTPTHHSLAVLLVCARTLAAAAYDVAVFKHDFSPAVSVTERDSRNTDDQLEKYSNSDIISARFNHVISVTIQQYVPFILGPLA